MSARRPNCNAVAHQIVEKFGPFIYDGSFFYRYESGVWCKIEERFIERDIKGLLGPRSTQHRIAETLNNLRLDCGIDAKLLNVERNILNLRNGLLDLATLTLSPHRTSCLSTIQLPVEYQATACCPLWEKFLNEVFECNDEYVSFLQEFIGYLFIPDVKLLEKGVIFLGPGSNGKGTTISIIERLLGEENCSAISLDRLDNLHYLVELHGKLLNVSTESNLRVLRNPDRLKQLISGDTVQADRKYHDPVKFRPHARFLFGMNELPQTSDMSYAYFRRWVILEFNRTFDEKSRDPKMEEKLAAELDGIFRWALEGLRRLQERGRFVEPSASVARVARYREESDSVRLFIQGACVLEKGKETRGGPLYTAYENWAEISGLRPLTSVKFSKALLACCGAQVTKDRDAKGVFYQGIAVRACQDWNPAGM